MRYISPFARLKLYKQNGDLAYSFEQHELVINSVTSTATADIIDATTKTPIEETLMRVYDQPITPGGPTELLELCGLGYLNNNNANWRLFYESPWVQAVTALTYDSYWLVNQGQVTYNNKTYYPGDIIQLASGDSLTLSGSNYISQWFFKGMLKEDDTVDRSALFRQNNLLVGDESPNYWTWSGGGYQPTNSLVSTDPNFFGWVR